jgi:hypothetical protein
LVRSSINQIIIDNRRKHLKYNNLTDKEIKTTQTVFKDEIFELFKEFGIPKIFELKKTNL